MVDLRLVMEDNFPTMAPLKTACFYLVLILGLPSFSPAENLVPGVPGRPSAEPWIETQVTLTWAPVAGADSYRIYRQTGQGPWVRIPGTVEGTYFEDTGLQDGFDYTYQVSALGPNGEGPRSEGTQVRTKAGHVRSLTAQAGDGSAVISWTPSPGALGYHIYRDTFTGTDGPVVLTADASPYTDRGLTNGTVYFYQVIPVNVRGETSFSHFTPAVRVIPSGSVRASGGTPAATPAGSEAPSVSGVSTVSGNRQVFLSWSGTARSWAVYRATGAGQEILLNSGMAGRSFTDAGLENGQTYRYRVQAQGAGGDGPFSSVVTALPRGAGPQPWSGTLSYGLPGEPVQAGSLEIPDLRSPITGVLFLNGQQIRNVPHLMAAARLFNLAVLELQEFNFGTPAHPVHLTTAWDRSHGIMPVDTRWPEQGALRLQSAFDALVRQFPDHPECARAGVVSYGFSLLAYANSSTLSQPVWAHRILAMVDFSNYEDHRMTLADSVPHLYVAASNNDKFSSLNLYIPVMPADWLPHWEFPWTTYRPWTNDSYARSWSTVRGAPLTTINNQGAGHGDNPDNPFIAVWLADVLSQRLPVPGTPAVLPDWTHAPGWTGCYDVLVQGTTVRLANLTAAPKDTNPDPRPYTWLPSRNTAQAWKDFGATGAPGKAP